MTLSPLPRLIVEPLVRAALAEDLGRAGDITSQLTIPVAKQATAKFVARKPGRIAGLICAEAAFRLVLARGPGREESAIFASALDRFQSYYRQHPLDAKKFVAQGRAPRDAALAPADLAAYTAISSLLLNTDEAITKE